jgi:uncharacterized DUF497 family protein
MEDDHFEWDDAKAEANFRKHAVGFANATLVFSDPLAIDDLDSDSEIHGEIRYRITGAARGKLLTVIYTERNGRIRLISAREASTREHDNYQSQNTQE